MKEEQGVLSSQKDGSIQWIPEQIVGIGEDSHSQVDDDNVKTILYKVRWNGYDRTDDTWEPIIHLQGYTITVKSFKESHEKMLKDWLLTVGVSQNQKKHMFSKKLPNILSCT